MRLILHFNKRLRVMQSIYIKRLSKGNLAKKIIVAKLFYNSKCTTERFVEIEIHSIANIDIHVNLFAKTS